MPPGQNDYDVVIGVTMSDQTAAGAASVKKSTLKLEDDIRQYGDRQAREISRSFRTTFSQLDQSTASSANGIIRKLTTIFDAQNFLIRNMARDIGGVTGNIIVGIGKLGLVFNKLGKDSQEAAHLSKVAMDDLKLAVSKLGSDSTAFPAAIKATRELSSAYVGMGLTGHAASVKAGGALEDLVHKRLVALQGGLVKAQSEFDKLKGKGTDSSEEIRKKLNTIATTLSGVFGTGKRVDSDFLKSLLSMKTSTEQYNLVLKQFGKDAGGIFLKHTDDVERLARNYVRLESSAAKSLKSQTTGLASSANKIQAYQTEIAGIEKALGGATTQTEEMAAASSGLLGVLGPAGLIIGGVVIVVLALAAAFAAASVGAYKLTKLASDTASEFKDVSDRVNLSVETLQALNIAEIKAGGNLQKLVTGLGMFDKNITQAYESNTKLAKQFKDFNIDVTDNEKALRQVLQRLQEMPDGAKQTELAMLAFGRSGKEVVGIIHNLDGSLDDNIKKLKAMGLIMSRDEVRAAAAFGDKLDILGLKIKMVGVRIGMEFLPYVEKIVDAFDRLADRTVPQVKSWTDSVIESIKNVGAALNAISAGPFGVGPTVDDGTWLMGKLLHWGTGVGVAVETLTTIYRLLDKIGSKVRGPQAIQAPSSFGASDAQRIKEQFIDKFQENQIKARAKAGDFSGLPFAQQEEINKLLENAQQRVESLTEAIKTFGDGTKYTAIQQENLKDKIKDLPGALEPYREAIQKKIDALHAESSALARQYDQLQEQQKEQEKVAAANQRAADELGGLKEKIQQANEQLGINSDLTKIAYTETDKFNQRLAAGKYAKVSEKATLDDLSASYKEYDKILQQVAQTKKEAKEDEQNQRLADSFENIKNRVRELTAMALPEREQRLQEAHRGFQQTVDEIFRVPNLDFIGGRKSLDKFAETLSRGQEAGGQDGLFQAFRAIITPDSLARLSKLNINVAEFVDLLIKAGKADAEIAHRQSTLGILEREYNELLKEQKELTDPLIQQQLLQNEYLRNTIDLQLEHRDALIATDKAQKELSDSTVYHADIANAKILEYLANQRSITEVIADAKIQVIDSTFSAIDRGLDKVTEKLGLAGDMVRELLSGFIRLALTPFFRSIYGGGGGGGISGGFPGGTPPFVGGSGGISQVLQNLGISGIAGSAASPSSIGSINPGMILRGGGVLTDQNVVNAQRNQGLFGMLGQTLLGVSPFLGLGAGAAAGGALGGIGGQVGGGLVGLGAALGIGNLFGSTALSTVAATLGISMTAVTAGLFGIGGVVLVASMIAKRNAERRRNETDRATLSSDTYTAIIQILNKARDGGYSSMNDAMADFNKVKSDYFTHISGYDSKTKKIATDVWYGNNKPGDPNEVGIERTYLPLIQKALDEGLQRENIRSRMIPVFSGGGTSDYDQFIKVRPGEGIRYPGSNVVHTVFGNDRGYDTEYMYVPRGTRIINRGEMDNASPMQTGGVVGGSSSGGPYELRIDSIEIQQDDNGLARAIIKSPDFKTAVVRSVKIAKKEKKIA